MTPEQKLKWAILNLSARWAKKPAPEVTENNVDDLYQELVDSDEHWDAKSEIRSSGEETGLPCEFSRHYEGESVAAKMPDGSWVGWMYWHGGGKHSEPEAIEWMSEAYDVNCLEEEKTVVVRTFSKPEEGAAA